MQRELEFKKNSEFDRGLGRLYCFSVPMGHPWPNGAKEQTLIPSLRPNRIALTTKMGVLHTLP